MLNGKCIADVDFFFFFFLPFRRFSLTSIREDPREFAGIARTHVEAENVDNFSPKISLLRCIILFAFFFLFFFLFCVRRQTELKFVYKRKVTDFDEIQHENIFFEKNIFDTYFFFFFFFMYIGNRRC